MQLAAVVEWLEVRIAYNSFSTQQLLQKSLHGNSKLMALQSIITQCPVGISVLTFSSTYENKKLSQMSKACINNSLTLQETTILGTYYKIIESLCPSLTSLMSACFAHTFYGLLLIIYLFTPTPISIISTFLRIFIFHRRMLVHFKISIFCRILHFMKSKNTSYPWAAEIILFFGFYNNFTCFKKV